MLWFMQVFKINSKRYSRKYSLKDLRICHKLNINDILLFFNVLSLLKETHDYFLKEANLSGKTRLLLTASVSAGKEFITRGYDIRVIQKLVAFYLMSPKEKNLPTKILKSILCLLILEN